MMIHFSIPPGLIKKLGIAVGAFVAAFFVLIFGVILLGGDQVPTATEIPTENTTNNTTNIPTETKTRSLPSQATTSRDPDDIRREHIDLIAKKMGDAITRNIAIPRPENALELFFGTQRIGFQGRAGQALFSAIGLVNPLDPETGDMYHMFYNTDTKAYEFLAFVKNAEKGNATVAGKPVYRAGKTLGNFVVTADNTILATILPDGEKIDLSSSSQRKLKNLPSYGSCKEIKAGFASAWSGKYTIDMHGKDLPVYCDMQTDGGGWTLFYANNGHAESKPTMSYVQLRDALEINPIDNLSEYNDKNLVGLLDYPVFIAQGAQEILIRNRAGTPSKWVKMSFSSSRALNWALSGAVLGTTENGCQKLPLRATWDIINEDSSLKHQKLTYLMNHGGTSWGVSHEKYPCNNYTSTVNPHIGFYNANTADSENRARSNDGIGGEWGPGNEYRYFIR